jgi:hypothetical protein
MLKLRAAALLASTVAFVTAGLAGAPVAAADAECGVRSSDGRLWCGNHAPRALYLTPDDRSGINGQLQSTFSYFICWKKGQTHGGGNNTWYYTDADWGGPGYIAAEHVFTPSWFDSFPKAYGLREC